MTLAIALLAAGGARRFGGGKLDADCAGKPLGRWALDAALAARWAEGCDALLIMLADMPLVSLETLRKLTRAPAAAVTYPGGRPGAPACFPAALVPGLAALTGDSGAAQVLRDLAGVTLIETSPEELRDVDRAEDLADVEALLRSR